MTTAPEPTDNGQPDGPHTGPPAGPLAGLRVIELAGIGPGPYACLLLAELGADVVRIDRPGGASWPGPAQTLNRSRRSIAVDIKSIAGRDVVLRLVEGADVLVEGLRPGVTERLGVGPEDCRAGNPRLIYGRMTGWGQDGPLALRAGHDITYAALTGALHAIGPADRPRPALNLVADFGGGSLFLVMGILAALHERESSGLGQVVDAAMVDGTASLMTMVYGLYADGVWRDEREANLLDGGAPFYDTYQCADGKHVAVGALEPQFYALLVERLGVRLEGGQHDREHWPAHRTAFAEAFATRTRDEWAAIFEGCDACVAPVLSLEEAPHHPHLRARQTFLPRDHAMDGDSRGDERAGERRDGGGGYEPRVAPRFSRTPGRAPSPPRPAGADSHEILRAAGFTDDEITHLTQAGVVQQTLGSLR
jgi:alpha-methylacyl-CoA racemase